MSYIKVLAASSMPRGEQDRTSLGVAYGLLLTQTRRKACG
jgi:hypothetical protein